MAGNNNGNDNNYGEPPMLFRQPSGENFLPFVVFSLVGDILDHNPEADVSKQGFDDDSTTLSNDSNDVDKNVHGYLATKIKATLLDSFAEHKVKATAPAEDMRIFLCAWLSDLLNNPRIDEQSLNYDTIYKMLDKLKALDEKYLKLTDGPELLTGALVILKEGIEADIAKSQGKQKWDRPV